MFMLTSLPVAGSRIAGCESFKLNGPTPKPAAVTYLRFATGRGRRYTETVGVALDRPYCEFVLQPLGSRTTSSANSGSIGRPSRPTGGHGRKTRINPRS